MFLLIRGNSSGDNYGLHCFTFHYVSINTGGDTTKLDKALPLHSTMFLLILVTYTEQMLAAAFTFHYVSINTVLVTLNCCEVISLHSTMFLLIRYKTSIVTGEMRSFTFHYVSINTRIYIQSNIHENTLHSTMFLLIPWYFSYSLWSVYLYIPLCFY